MKASTTKTKEAGASRGFTLVEIAIVLVIIGLLLGGILKGQELINNAKVRAISDRQNSLKAAWFAFVDRFAALPGDYIQANIYITGAAAGNGNGILDIKESPLVFQHLASAGYLRCPQCTETATDTLPTAANSLINTYGGIMSIWNDENFYAVQSDQITPARRLMIHTGPRIPSSIMAEVDRKIDDGVPNTGDLRFNSYDVTSPTKNFHGADTEQCMKGDVAGTINGDLLGKDVQFWRPANSSPPVWQDCGGSVFI